MMMTTPAAKNGLPHVATAMPAAENTAKKADYQGDMVTLLRHELLIWKRTFWPTTTPKPPRRWLICTTWKDKATRNSARRRMTEIRR
jgi:hypothetical protein